LEEGKINSENKLIQKKRVGSKGLTNKSGQGLIISKKRRIKQYAYPN
jgi:hypothetical protein